MAEGHTQPRAPSPDRERDLIRAAQREAAPAAILPSTSPLAPGSPAHACVPSPLDHVAVPFDAEPSRVSDSLPGYEIIREIHRGGQGVVYQAVQKSTRRRVAIKVMHERPFSDARDTARFEREVRILGALTHPNIVTIHDSGALAGRYFFVMDYISGQPLDQYMSAKEHSIADTLRLFARICDAVNAAHLRGVIHRDLKPGNIRIDSGGEPHVLDFGLAKLATGDVTDPHSSGHPQVMTETGHFIGTPAWASPEQAEGARDKIDIRTDVYSLGVIIFQMLTGTFPYEVVGKRGEVLQNIGSAPPARPSSLRRDIDRDVETIVLKCLAKERERRYQSAGELARDVRHYLGREPIEARRDSATYVIRKLLARHRLRIVGAAGLLLAATLVWGIVDARRRLGASQRTEALSDARWSLDQGDYAACLRRVQPIFERTPNDTEAVLLQARALLRLGRESEADRVLSAAVAANPQSGAIRYLLAEITAKSDPQRSSELREEARRLEKDSPQDYYLRALSAQQDQPAVDLLTHALDLNPRYFEALMARGARYFNLKAFDAMRTDAERALSIRPHDARAWCNLGIAWLNLGDDAQAVRALERAAEFDATLARVWINLGVCYERSAKAQPALECYTRAAHLDPMQFPAWMGLARIYLRLERFDDAQDALQRALNLQPKNARALYHQALLDSRRGKHEAALAGFEKCVGAPSIDQARVWLSLASTFWELRRPQDALQACQRVLEIDARSGSSWSFAAWLLLTEDTLQDFRLAHQNAQRAFELLPGDARVLGCLALAEARALEWPAADEHARRALEVSGTWSQAWPLGLCARTALESGDLERARALRAQAGDAATDYHEPDVAALQAFLREFDERVVELNKESAND